MDDVTLTEWINLVPGELPIDAVGLWQIIPTLQHDFGLEGEKLTEAVKRTIITLIQHGAKPVRGGRGTGRDWIEQPHYGSTPEEIARKIIIEWSGWSFAEPALGGLWFALPELFG
ncbi:hypothetical protein [Acidisoma silvae]|uniref:Uncharacterized protein n=1 Tax=Acidisoma silvae TaxID=2802396 RepID=A0A964DZX4_9PROT|nr:hypothetical protein [Acidisoma silvae]MCB8876554.1 hypothetical protein [Acidisoma silvae]